MLNIFVVSIYYYAFNISGTCQYAWGEGGGVWGCILGVRMHPKVGKLFQNHKIMQQLGISPETEFTSLMLPSK